MAGIRLEGNTSGNVAEVDAGNHLLVNLGKTLAQAGYAVQMNENDPGAVTGTPFILSPEVTDDYRQRVGLDTVLVSEAFNYAAQDSGKWSNILSSFTVTYATGFMILNGGSSVTTAQGALVKSYKTVPFFGASPTYVEFHALYTQTPQANNVMELGVGIPTTSNGALTDGVCFRWDATGVLKGVLNYNGSETLTSVLTSPAANSVFKYTITCTTNLVRFWIDDVLQATLLVPSGVGGPSSEAALPIIMRCYNSGTVSLAQQLKVTQCTASLGDWATNKRWEHQMSAMGQHCTSAQGGSTAGLTTNNVNITAPTTGTPSNTAAGYTTLGGQWQIAAVGGAETDLIMFGYTNPVSAVGVTGKTLHITDIAIDTTNTVVAVATTATVFQWTLGYGSTALTLATAEGAATKIARRVNLGVQAFPVAAAVGAVANQVNRSFSVPVVVNPGELVHIILKVPIGTATATEIFRGTVSINGYWE